MKIMLDCLGGDLAPKAPIEGAREALKRDKSIRLVLLGDENEIKTGLSNDYDPNRVEIINAPTAVLNTDHPALFLKQKPDSSLAVGYENLRKRDDIDAFVSAGPTGAILTGGVLRLGRLKGVERPALMATLPTRTGKLIRLVDVGANMDCKASYLLQFALMADTYLKLNGIENPRIGLLNVGSEEGKGNELAKETFNLLKEANINFVGNIEGDHVLKGEADAIVCDGFWGNVFLKATEEACYYISDLFKEALYKNIFTKLGALLQLKGLKKVKEPFNYAKKACAPLLGCKKIVLKCHGKSDSPTFAETILEASRLAENKLIEKLSNALNAEKE